VGYNIELILYLVINEGEVIEITLQDKQYWYGNIAMIKGNLITPSYNLILMPAYLIILTIYSGGPLYIATTIGDAVFAVKQGRWRPQLRVQF
jgi:hypothetical protein